MGSGQYNQSNQYNQGNQPYNMSSGWSSGGQRVGFGRAIGLGCLVLVVLFFLFFFSCTRACFRPRRYRYMRYTQLVVPPQAHRSPIIQA
jgi:hypothetical protein